MLEADFEFSAFDGGFEPIQTDAALCRSVSDTQEADVAEYALMASSTAYI